MNDNNDLISEYLVHLSGSEMALQNSIFFLSRAIHLEPKTKKELEEISLMEIRNSMEQISQLIRNLIIEKELKRD